MEHSEKAYVPTRKRKKQERAERQRQEAQRETAQWNQATQQHNAPWDNGNAAGQAQIAYAPPQQQQQQQQHHQQHQQQRYWHQAPPPPSQHFYHGPPPQWNNAAAGVAGPSSFLPLPPNAAAPSMPPTWPNAAAPPLASAPRRSTHSPLPLRSTPRPAYTHFANLPTERFPRTLRAPPTPLPLLVLDLNGTLVFRKSAAASANPVRRPYLRCFLQYALGVPCEMGTLDALWREWSESRRMAKESGETIRAAARPHGAEFWPLEGDATSTQEEQKDSTHFRTYPNEPLPTSSAKVRLLLWSSAQQHNVQSMTRAILTPRQAAHLLRVYARETLVPRAFAAHKAESCKDLEIVWAALNGVGAAGAKATSNGDAPSDAESGETSQDWQLIEGERRLMAQYRSVADVEVEQTNGLNAIITASERCAIEAQSFVAMPQPPGVPTAQELAKVQQARALQEAHRLAKEGQQQQGGSGGKTGKHKYKGKQGKVKDKQLKTALKEAENVTAAFDATQATAEGSEAALSSEWTNGRGYGQHNTLLLDDSPEKARLQPFNHLLLPPFDEARAAQVRAYLAAQDAKAAAINEEEIEIGLDEGSSECEDEEDDGSSNASSSAAASFIVRQATPLESQLDNVLLQLVGVLEHARWERNVSAWIRSGALGYFGGMQQPGVVSVRMAEVETDTTLDAQEPQTLQDQLRLDTPSHLRTEHFWAEEGRRALRIAGIACEV